MESFALASGMSHLYTSNICPKKSDSNKKPTRNQPAWHGFSFGLGIDAEESVEFLKRFRHVVTPSDTWVHVQMFNSKVRTWNDLNRYFLYSSILIPSGSQMRFSHIFPNMDPMMPPPEMHIKRRHSHLPATSSAAATGSAMGLMLDDAWNVAAKIRRKICDKATRCQLIFICPSVLENLHQELIKFQQSVSLLPLFCFHLLGSSQRREQSRSIKI